MVLDRILGGDHQERLRQRIRMRVHRDLAFIHGLEQRGLSLGGGAVDLIREQDVGENRFTLELKLLLDGGVVEMPRTSEGSMSLVNCTR